MDPRLREDDVREEIRVDFLRVEDDVKEKQRASVNTEALRCNLK